MAHEKLRPEFTFDDDKINQLKQIVPECFEDGKINFETLRQNLGDWAQDEDDDTLEHFGLFWPGKKEARKLAAIPSEGTLEPVYGEGLKPDGTPDTDGNNDSKNIFIEGENLEVLKILQKSYANRIKMIYIDPPYNTGNDFVYDDDFTEPLQEYLRRTGQIDEEGKPLTTNKRSDGRFHSKWLSMMYPRLRLARNLLKDDGVIFVSIDDNEVHNLRAIMNEIFGEENFIAQLVWEKKKKGAFLSGDITNVKEYVIVYSKAKDSFNGLIGEIARQTETYPVIKTTNTRGIRIIPKGIASKYRESSHFVKKGSRISSGNMELILLSDMIIENSVLQEDVEVDSNWIYSQKLLDEYANNDKLYITQDLYFRRIVDEPREKKMKDILPRVGTEGLSGSEYIKSDNLFSDGWGTNEDGNAELHDLLGIQNLFDFPKPSKLISKLIASLHDNDCLVLDFFSGSGTLAQSTMAVNDATKGSIQYICVQLPQEITKEDNAYNHGYRKITEITKDRIVNSGKKYNCEDIGFNYFKLNNSNYKKWQDINSIDVNQVELALDEFANSPLKPNWSKNKLLTEIQLLEGFPLDSKLETSNFGKNEVNQISHEDLETKLLICLDDNIEENLISDLKLDSNTIFICLDTAISNQHKLRLSDKGLIKTI